MLTTAQKATLKTDILANGDTLALYTSGDLSGLAALLNTVVATTFFVYRTDVPPQDVFNQITWANFTPVDAPDGTLLWQNRALSCQGKQFNVQILLQGQAVINAAKGNVRAGLQDALTNVPSGASGALLSAGWVAVRDNALARGATRVEKLFATGGNGSTAALAATMAVEGPLSYTEMIGL